MAASVALGIDIGTTGLKVVTLDPEQGVIDQVHRAHTLRSPHPGWAEEDAAEWWATTADALREVTTRVSPARIAAVGVTGMVPAMVLLDEAGQVLRPAILQNDARSIDELAALHAALDLDEFFAITGGMPSQQNIAPRWLWLARHEPEVVARTARLCGSYDAIVHRLTGSWSLEENWAAESGLYDVRRHAWHAPYLARAGIAPEFLPPVRRPTDVVGAIHAEAARLTGLRVGTPVVAGSADHVAAALASGLTGPGDVLLKFGGAGDILYCSAQPDPDRSFFFDYHDIPGLTLINGCMAASGSFVRWFAAEVAGGASLAELDAEAAHVPPGAGGIVALPYVLGEKTPIFDPGARGVFAGVMLHHTRAHLYRAVLESVCYGFRHHLELLSAAGRQLARLLAADGGSRSTVWMQIAADVTGRAVQVVSGEAASATGAAFVAGMGVGLFDEWGAIERFVTRGPCYTPNPEAAARYDAGYAVYRDLYPQLRGVFPALRLLDTG